jgi:hypothetical protein
MQKRFLGENTGEHKKLSMLGDNFAPSDTFTISKTDKITLIWCTGLSANYD